MIILTPPRARGCAAAATILLQLLAVMQLQGGGPQAFGVAACVGSSSVDSTGTVTGVENYIMGSDCTFHISAPAGYGITLAYLKFDVKQSVDWLKVFTTSTTVPEYGYYFGYYVPFSMNFTRSTLTLQWHSETGAQQIGWLILVTFTSPICGLYEPAYKQAGQTISMLQYSNNMQCR